jgi:hypothetical protein
MEPEEAASGSKPYRKQKGNAKIYSAASFGRVNHHWIFNSRTKTENQSSKHCCNISRNQVQA